MAGDDRLIRPADRPMIPSVVPEIDEEKVRAKGARREASAA
jgi:hypothetical protein